MLNLSAFSTNKVIICPQHCVFCLCFCFSNEILANLSCLKNECLNTLLQIPIYNYLEYSSDSSYSVKPQARTKYVLYQLEMYWHRGKR